MTVMIKKKYSREILYLSIFVVLLMISKLLIDELLYDIGANVLLLMLSLWYLNGSKIFSLKKIWLQVVEGGCSAAAILFIVIMTYYFLFDIYTKLDFSKELFLGYFLFQILVAITEELVYRESLYKVFLHFDISMKMSALIASFVFAFVLCSICKCICFFCGFIYTKNKSRKFYVDFMYGIPFGIQCIMLLSCFFMSFIVERLNILKIIFCGLTIGGGL